MKIFIKRISLLVILCLTLVTLTTTVYATAQDLLLFYAVADGPWGPHTVSGGIVVYFDEPPTFTFTTGGGISKPLSTSPVTWYNPTCEDNACQAEWDVEIYGANKGEMLHIIVEFSDGSIVTDSTEILGGTPGCGNESCADEGTE